MGFWETVGKVGASVAEGMQKRMEEAQKTKSQFEFKSDQELISIYKRDSGIRKQIAATILKERGHTKETVMGG